MLRNSLPISGIFLFSFIALLFSSCSSLFFFETADIAPKGKLQQVAAVSGTSFLDKSSNPNFTSDIPAILPSYAMGVRVGLTDRTDIGGFYDILGNMNLRFKYQIRDSSAKTKIAFGPSVNSSLFLLMNDSRVFTPAMVLYTSHYSNDMIFYTNYYLAFLTMKNKNEPLRGGFYGLGLNAGFLSEPLKIKQPFRIGFQLGFMLGPEVTEFRFSLGVVRHFN